MLAVEALFAVANRALGGTVEIREFAEREDLLPSQLVVVDTALALGKRRVDVDRGVGGDRQEI